MDDECGPVLSRAARYGSRKEPVGRRLAGRGKIGLNNVVCMWVEMERQSIASISGRAGRCERQISVLIGDFNIDVLGQRKAGEGEGNGEEVEHLV